MKNKFLVIAIMFSTMALAKQTPINIWVENDHLSPGGFICLQGCEQDGLKKLKEECETKYRGVLSGGAKASATPSKVGFITFGTCVVESANQ